MVGKVLCALKKAVASILILVLLLLPGVAFAEVVPYSGTGFSEGMTGILMEARTGRVLYEKDADKQIYPASTTKILTALVVLDEAQDLDEEITVGDEVNKFGTASSLMYLRSGHSVTVRDLLYGLMLPSGNDAAAALAVHFGESVDGFCDMMNAKAKELGMHNSNFTNPHGLSMLDSDNTSTARDMGRLALAAHQNDTLMEIMSSPAWTVESTELNRENQTLSNGNVLIKTPDTESGREKYADYLYPPATGMKTGLLANVDGNSWYGCLVASASKDGVDVVTGVFADTSERGIERWGATINLCEYAFNNYAWVDLSRYITPPRLEEQVSGYAENDPQQGRLYISSAAGAKPPGMELMDKKLVQALEDGSIQAERTVNLVSPLTAPVTQGEEMGTVTYTLNGEEIYSVAVKAERSVYELGEEEETKAEYALPAPAGKTPGLWWLWIVIPAAAAGGYFLLDIFVLRKHLPQFDILKLPRHIGMRGIRGHRRARYDGPAGRRGKRKTYYFDSNNFGHTPTRTERKRRKRF
jgi:D-alanyl-D-alanine carboxypeptidase